MIYILYNPFASGVGEEAAQQARAYFSREEAALVSMIGRDVGEFASELTGDDTVVLCGGDGTINRFANDTYGCGYAFRVLLWRSGARSDFLRDVGGGEGPLELNRYLENLPTVEVKGSVRRFINGASLGLDGLAYQVAGEKKIHGERTVNCTKQSEKLILHGYRRPNAKVTVDGEVRRYSGVWLAAVMNGRYCGSGMMMAPQQDRLSGRLSLVVMHGAGRLRTLLAFSGIYKGRPAKRPDLTDVLTGREITVEFDRPSALQIDGEVVRGVIRYTARVGVPEPTIRR